MKSKFIFILLTLVITSCNKQKENFAVIKLDKIIKIGIIGENDTILKSVKIKNISNTTLKIKQIKASCGCTIVDLKDSLVESGKSTYINIKYISDNKKGNFSKSIVIDANTKPNFNVIYLKGMIK